MQFSPCILLRLFSLTTLAVATRRRRTLHTTTSFSGRRGRMGAQTARAAASFHVPSRTSRVGPQSSRCALSSCSLLVWLEPIILELDCFVPNEAELGRGSIWSNPARAFFLSINSRLTGKGSCPESANFHSARIRPIRSPPGSTSIFSPQSNSVFQSYLLLIN